MKGLFADAWQQCLGKPEKDDEREREIPRAAGAVPELMLEVFDYKLVVRHVRNESHERERVHKGCVVAVDVEGEKSVNKQIGGVNDPSVAVGDTACGARVRRWLA